MRLQTTNAWNYKRLKGILIELDPKSLKEVAEKLGSYDQVQEFMYLLTDLVDGSAKVIMTKCKDQKCKDQMEFCHLSVIQEFIQTTRKERHLSDHANIHDDKISWLRKLH